MHEFLIDSNCNKNVETHNPKKYKKHVVAFLACKRQVVVRY